ncbi:hypothetical protein G6F40_014332 [Rhizopus arrhizus]|nr:hypothetical protein G6F40_014332 [Rhizopus arrhizus]
MISSLTERGADTTLQALSLGAVDFVSKPKLDVARGLQGYADEIIAKVNMAARSRVRPLVRAATPKLTLEAAPAMRPAAPHPARGAGRPARRRAGRGDDPAPAGQFQHGLRRAPGPALGDGRARGQRRRSGVARACLPAPGRQAPAHHP